MIIIPAVRKLLGAAAIAVISIIGTVVLQETVKQKLAIFFYSPTLSYEVISISNISYYDLTSYSQKELHEEFNLDLDDPFISSYTVVQLKIRNEGPAISNGFKFALFLNGPAKIMDIKHIVRAPANKTLAIAHSVPRLKWEISSKQRTATITWNSDKDGVLGHYVYKSMAKDVGYGAFTSQLIKQSCFRINIDAMLPGYYAILSVGVSGVTSGLSRPPLRFPEALSFVAYFKDVIWIDPQLNQNIECSRAREYVYPSLVSALAKQGRSRTFIIAKRRNEAGNIADLLKANSEDLHILYEDDLDFLRGRTELSFPAGLDDNAEIDFYVLAKTLSFTPIDLTVSLIGQPSIKLNKRRSKSEVIKSGDETSINMLLTPKLVTPRLDKKRISLVWPAETDDAYYKYYKGVRIFRTTIKNGRPVESLGTEIYSGPGTSGYVECHLNKQLRNESKVASVPGSAPMEPPALPSRPKGVNQTKPTPNAPSGLHMNSSGDEQRITFYTDTEVLEGEEYKYTIYAFGEFDERMVYSYPVEVRTSLKDLASGLFCAVRDRKSLSILPSAEKKPGK